MAVRSSSAGTRCLSKPHCLLVHFTNEISCTRTLFCFLKIQRPQLHQLKVPTRSVHRQFQCWSTDISWLLCHFSHPSWEQHFVSEIYKISLVATSQIHSNAPVAQTQNAAVDVDRIKTYCPDLLNASSDTLRLGLAGISIPGVVKPLQMWTSVDIVNVRLTNPP